MSEYEYKIDDTIMICPYCGEGDFQPEPEDFSEDTNVHECGNCGMNYSGRQSFSVANHSEPDCSLNNTDHEWEYFSSCDAEFCSVCGQINSEYVRAKYYNEIKAED